MLTNKKLYLYTEQDLDNFLKNRKSANTNRFQKKLLDLQLNTPYKTNPLGKEQNNKLTFNYKYLDCTTFVLTNYVLTYASNLKDAKSLFRKLLYYPASNYKITYDNRIHFTLDRLKTNKFFEIIILDNNNNLYEIKNGVITLNKKKNDKKLLEINFEKQINYQYYLINENIKNLKLKNPTGCALIKSGTIKNGHLISHEGIIINDTLYHASKDKSKVIKVNLKNYLNTNKFNGIIFFKFKNKKRKDGE